MSAFRDELVFWFKSMVATLVFVALAHYLYFFVFTGIPE